MAQALLCCFRREEAQDLQKLAGMQPISSSLCWSSVPKYSSHDEATCAWLGFPYTPGVQIGGHARESWYISIYGGLYIRCACGI